MTGQTEQADLMERLRAYASGLQRTYDRVAKDYDGRGRFNPPTDDQPSRDRYVQDRGFNNGQVKAYRHSLGELRETFPELEGLLRALDFRATSRRSTGDSPSPTPPQEKPIP